MVTHKFSLTDRDRLDGDFTKEELFDSLLSMQNGESPGINGLPCEFYKAMWDTVGDYFCNLIWEVFYFRKLSKSLTQGLIKFIPKNVVRYYLGVASGYPIECFLQNYEKGFRIKG